jgi:hypothetical protein
VESHYCEELRYRYIAVDPSTGDIAIVAVFEKVIRPNE